MTAFSARASGGSWSRSRGGAEMGQLPPPPLAKKRKERKEERKKRGEKKERKKGKEHK